MAKFSSKNQPERRGKQWFKTKLIASLRRQGMTEDEFLDALVKRAIAEGGVFLTELLKRYSPLPKPTHDPITIDDWPKDGTPSDKANIVMNHMAEGNIPPDLGALMIESISKSLGIEELTQLTQRLEALEKIINAEKA